MADDTFTTWLERGRAHQREGRPVDAIPCYRRASRELPGSPVPHFHLGEVWWQLGRPGAALEAWRRAADLDAAFLPPRLALVEAGLHEGRYAVARDAAEEAAAAAPSDARGRATRLVAAAALGDRAALAALAPILVHDDALAKVPSIARAIAHGIDRVPPEDARALVGVLAPAVSSLPAVLVAALVRQGVSLPDSYGARPFTLDDRVALRELAVALQSRAPRLAGQIADAHGALTCALPQPPMAFLWPRRTRGRALRLAWVLPSPADAAWGAASRPAC